MESKVEKFTPITTELNNDSTIGVHVMGWQIANLYEHEPELSCVTHTYLEDGELGRFFVDEFRPTSNMAHAMLVIQKLREIGEYITISDIGDLWDVAYTRGDTKHPICANDKSLPSAVCRAAILITQDRATRDNRHGTQAPQGAAEQQPIPVV